MPAPLAITLGDPAGIGPEIIAKYFAQAAATDAMQDSVVFGDPAHLQRALDVLGMTDWRLQLLKPSTGLQAANEPRTIAVADPAQWPGLAAQGAPPSRATLVPVGQISARAGWLAAQAVVAATQAALRGEVSAVVTAPLHKEALAAAGVDYPGHTELLQAQAAQFQGVPVQDMPVRMMLANDELRTVLVSIHVALREALDLVTTERVLQTIRITHESLAKLLGRAPRIAVAGLNPHAGEGGLFGREDLDQIAPAVAAALSQGLVVSGPHAPDTVFMRARAGDFDVVVAMYHDQGLIPVKYLGLDQGVNVTLGLPLVRTSPDHGTAFDLAGTGRADAASLLAALRMARRLLPTAKMP
jgi:4-hydroxythreonine-4-phosphate dehydrogenase